MLTMLLCDHSHRLNTIMESDRVLVMDAGKVRNLNFAYVIGAKLTRRKMAEFDSPANLLSRPDTIFYSLVKQAGLTTGGRD
jgi:energy-coupling factor transporter ATP-binding protein EcfA2